MNWTEYFRQIAQTVKLKSKDKNTQIGAIIVGSNSEIRSTGYNSFPRNIDDFRNERQERPEKYFWFSHAETNALINAARIGVSTNNCVMYLTCDIPCVDCTRNIINAGIKVIYCEKGQGAQGDHWHEHTKRSLQMITEAGLTVWYYGEDRPFINMGDMRYDAKR